MLIDASVQGGATVPLRVIRSAGQALPAAHGVYHMHGGVRRTSSAASRAFTAGGAQTTGETSTIALRTSSASRRLAVGRGPKVVLSHTVYMTSCTCLTGSSWSGNCAGMHAAGSASMHPRARSVSWHVVSPNHAGNRGGVATRRAHTGSV
eukprot:363847-Chlamydomonas_euryale.AAC.2